MALIRGHLFVVRYCSSSSGAHLLDVDPNTGTIRVDRPLRGLGPVSHYGYFNRVTIEEIEEHPVVRGVESLGRYVELLALDSGATKLSRTDRSPYASR